MLKTKQSGKIKEAREKKAERSYLKIVKLERSKIKRKEDPRKEGTNNGEKANLEEQKGGGEENQRKGRYKADIPESRAPCNQTDGQTDRQSG